MQPPYDLKDFDITTELGLKCNINKVRDYWKINTKGYFLSAYRYCLFAPLTPPPLTPSFKHFLPYSTLDQPTPLTELLEPVELHHTWVMGPIMAPLIDLLIDSIMIPILGPVMGPIKSSTKGPKLIWG